MAESLIEKAKRLNIQPVAPTESLVDKAKRLGIEPQKPKGYLGRVGEQFSDIGQEITGAIKDNASSYEDYLNRVRSGDRPTLKEGLGVGLDLARSGLRAVGGVAQGAFAPIFQAPVIKQATEFVVSKVAEQPKVKETITKATELAQRYPEQAKDIQNIIDIVTLGYAPKATSLVAKEGKAIASDISQASKIALTPSEQVVQSQVIDLFNRSIKPSKKSLMMGEKYENSTLNALKTIKANADNLNIEDVSGEIITGTPQTISELGQALNQTKEIVFKQYDDLARQAGTGGAVVDAKPIAIELDQVAQNKALQLTNPEVIKYAQNWAKKLRDFDTIDTQTAQEVVKLMNKNLEAFYRNPTYGTASQVAIDAGIANNFRKALDEAIQNATGAEYQALKNQYGALKAIESDVVNASAREAKKNTKGLLDYTDIFTGGQMVGGILSLNPAMFTKGAVERGFKEYFKMLNDPNRAVSQIFDLLETPKIETFSPQSATGKYLKNPKLGLSVEDVSRRDNGMITRNTERYNPAPVKATSQYEDQIQAITKEMQKKNMGIAAVSPERAANRLRDEFKELVGRLRDREDMTWQDRRVAYQKFFDDKKAAISTPDDIFKPIKDATPAVGLSAEERLVENKAFAKLDANPQKALDDYNKIPEAEGGKVVNTDLARRIFKDEGYVGSNSRAVQEPSSALAKVAFQQGLKNKGDVVLTAGGSGTGKSSAIGSLMKEDLSKAAVILDGNLSSMKSALARIKEANDSGKVAHIVYVYREPLDSWVNGVVKRMTNNVAEGGRAVPASVVAENHIGSYNVVKELLNMQRLGKLKNVRFDFIDNSLGAGKQQLMDFEKFVSLKYPSVDELKEIFIKNIDAKLKPEQIKGLSQ